jgi:two-component system sensor histidine kinase KdpD
VNSQRVIAALKWSSAAVVLAGIVAAYHFQLHVNQTTVALTLLLYILFLAARWGLRYAVVMSVAATFLYNFYFLPPVGTLVINDPQNWLALFAFLTTSVVGARLSERAREEAEEARLRQSEIEILYGLSRELLQTENVASLLNAVAPAVMLVTHANAVVLHLLNGDRRYLAGDPSAIPMDEVGMRQLALSLPAPDVAGLGEARVPLRVGVRPRGLLIMAGVHLSTETLEAIGSLVSIALDRAQALDDVTRAEAAREGERLRSLMIDSVTHELRTPLTSIKASASMLLMHDHRSANALAPESERELLTIIDEEADRLNRLVSDAVEMAQLDAQDVRMTFAPVQLATTVEAAIDACAGMLSNRDFRRNIPALPKVLADAEYLEKVIIHLLENAGKYSAVDSPIFLSAQVDASRQPSMVTFSVADRGQGIDSSEQELIFERFYRGGTSGCSASGTGMGLAISRAIMEAHHGTLNVTSRVGEGSVFTLSLPVAGSSF